MNLITEFQYFPSVILFKNLYKVSDIVFEQYEYYQKMSFRNRCQIAGAEGIIQLSVPLEHGRDQKTLVRDVRIAGRREWQGQHWKTILSCYSRSPWFEFYRDDLGRLYQKPFLFLVDWDLACFEWSVRALQMTLAISRTEYYRKNYDEKDGLDWRGRLKPNTVSKIIDVSKNTPNNPKSDMEAQNSPGPIVRLPMIKYHQVYEERTGFQPGLSILDLLFCEGKNAGPILRENP
jgi:hypothetical protein